MWGQEATLLKRQVVALALTWTWTWTWAWVKCSEFDQFEIRLAHATLWAGPLLGDIGPQGARRNAFFWSAGGLVVDEAANNAEIRFK
jgi:hypothetical protein